MCSCFSSPMRKIRYDPLILICIFPLPRTRAAPTLVGRLFIPRATVGEPFGDRAGPMDRAAFIAPQRNNPAWLAELKEGKRMALGCAINTSSTLAAEICSGAPRLQPRASCKPLTRLPSHAASCLLSQPLLTFPLTPPLCLARSYGLRLHPHRSAALCHRSGEDPLPAASRTRRWLQGHGPRGWLLRPRRHPAGL